MSRGLALALSLSGCATPQPPPVDVLAAPPSATAEPAPRAAPPPSLKAPSWTACRLFADRPYNPMALRVSPEGPDWLELSASVEIEVRLPLDDDHASAFVTVLGEGLRLTSFAAMSAVPLFAAAPLRFEGMAIPYATTPLAWLGQGGGALRVQIPTDPQVEVARPLETNARCEELSLQPTRWSRPAFEDAGMARVTTFPLALATEPGGPTVATLQDRPPRAALLLAEGAQQTQIALHGRLATYVGWVDAAAVVQGTSPTSPPGTTHGTKFVKASIGPLQHWRCDHELPLQAIVGDQPLIVGSIAAGQPWKGTAASEGLVDVVLPFARALGASRLAVEASKLEACAPP